MMEDNTLVDGSKFQEAKESTSSVTEPGATGSIRLNPNDDTYDMNGIKYLIIFNHSTYKKPGYFFTQEKLSDRVGTEFDVKRLINVFGEVLDHKVIVHHNLSYDQIIDEVQEITKSDHTNTSSVCVAILTHGDTDGTVSAYDRFYPLNDIFTMFQKSDKTLLGKPKLFFIQACRGDQVESGREVETDGTSKTYVIPSQADFLVLYSTIEGFLSFRGTGTWMIQSLCDIIETDDNYKTQDILTIITRVNNKVAYERMSFNLNPILHKKKQMPECKFTLTKQLYFRPTLIKRAQNIDKNNNNNNDLNQLRLRALSPLAIK